MCFIKSDHIKIGGGLPELKLKILDLSIQESYFVGHCELDGIRYLLNIQNQSGGKIIKFPFDLDEDIVGISISGKNTQVQDELKFKGKSEWIEIYSDIITNYLADHQQGPEWLDVLAIQ
jgi:hypothetical protein